MNDKELLEYAAKAAGIEVEWSDITECFWGDGDSWVPLDDDGDALRLAVKLELRVAWYEGKVYVDYIVEQYDNDPYAATRRAIVRAAAEIGRQA